MITSAVSAFLQTAMRPLKWWVVVAEWEQGVRVRLGKKPKHLLPGLHFRIPWVDRVYVQSVRLRTFVAASNATCQTRTGRTAVLSLAIHFRVENILRLYDTMSSPESTLGTLAVEKAIAFIEGSSLDVCSADVAAAIELDKEEVSAWGLADLRISVTGFAYCRALRVMAHDYAGSTGMLSLDHDEGGERK